MANTTQIDLFCNDLIGVRPAIQPPQQQLLAGMVSAATLGHRKVKERYCSNKRPMSTLLLLVGLMVERRSKQRLGVVAWL